MSKYICLGTLKYDKKIREIGDEIELTDEQLKATGFGPKHLEKVVGTRSNKAKGK